ncbi:MAG: alginate export family protein [Bacteroidales bacterium]|nr:alginate export family protein [Bacteroidales bacterium]
MNRKRLFIMVLVLLCSGIALRAQFAIDAEFRPRTEFRDGYKSLKDDESVPALVTAQRSRLNISFNKENVLLGLSLQDIRVWGESPYKTDVASMNVNQAWAGYKFNDALILKLGRQTLSYDDGRLLGSRNWNNVGASHDVALLSVSAEKLSVDVGAAYNNDSDKKFESYYPVDYYKFLTYIWVNNKFSDNLSVSLMNIMDGFQLENSDNVYYSRFTSGPYAKFKHGAFSVASAFYYQYGVSSEGHDISAYFFHIKPAYEINDAFNLAAGIDYLSGDDVFSDDDKVNSFDKLYGTGHGYYGYMDYFTEFPGHTDGGGLNDIYLQLNYALKQTSFELTAHQFALTGTLVDSLSQPGIVKKAKKGLGTEIDVMIKQKLNGKTDVRFGYSTMLATNTMEIIKGGDASKYQQWVWVMFTFKPTLFKQE